MFGSNMKGLTWFFFGDAKITVKAEKAEKFSGHVLVGRYHRRLFADRSDLASFLLRPRCFFNQPVFLSRIVRGAKWIGPLRVVGLGRRFGSSVWVVGLGRQSPEIAKNDSED